MVNRIVVGRRGRQEGMRISTPGEDLNADARPDAGVSFYSSFRERLLAPLSGRPGAIAEALLGRRSPEVVTWTGERDEAVLAGRRGETVLPVRRDLGVGDTFTLQLGDGRVLTGVQRSDPAPSAVDHEALEQDRARQVDRVRQRIEERINERIHQVGIEALTDSASPSTFTIEADRFEIRPPNGDSPPQISIRGGTVTDGRIVAEPLDAFALSPGQGLTVDFSPESLLRNPTFETTDLTPTIVDTTTMPPGVRPASTPMMGFQPRMGLDDQGKIEAPVVSRVAGMELEPGVAVCIRTDGRAIECGTKNRDGSVNPDWAGIVDPFLTGNVMEGTRFWMLQRVPVRVAVPEVAEPVRAVSGTVIIGNQTLLASEVRNETSLQGGSATIVTIPGRHSTTFTGRNRLTLDGVEFAIQRVHTTRTETRVTCRPFVQAVVSPDGWMTPTVQYVAPPPERRAEVVDGLDFIINGVRYRATTIDVQRPVRDVQVFGGPSRRELTGEQMVTVVCRGPIAVEVGDLLTIMDDRYVVTGRDTSDFSEDTTIRARRVVEQPAAGSASESTVSVQSLMSMMRELQRSGARPETLVVSRDAHRELLRTEARGHVTIHHSGNDLGFTFMGTPVVVSDDLPRGQAYVQSGPRRNPLPLAGPAVTPQTMQMRTQTVVSRRPVTHYGVRHPAGYQMEVPAGEAYRLTRGGDWVYGRVAQAAPQASQGMMTPNQMRRASRPRHTDDPPDLGEDQ